MREVIVRIKDDLNHKLIADQTIEFAWRGVDYEIDLSDAHANEADAMMARYIEVARKVKKSRQRKTGVPLVNGERVQPPEPRRRAAQNKGKPLRDAVRAYANAHGIEHAATGLLKRAAVDLWLKEHPDDAEALRNGSHAYG